MPVFRGGSQNGASQVGIVRGLLLHPMQVALRGI
jgi:hypothetical protein